MILLANSHGLCNFFGFTDVGEVVDSPFDVVRSRVIGLSSFSSSSNSTKSSGLEKGEKNFRSQINIICRKR